MYDDAMWLLDLLDQYLDINPIGVSWMLMWFIAFVRVAKNNSNSRRRLEKCYKRKETPDAIKAAKWLVLQDGMNSIVAWLMFGAGVSSTFRISVNFTVFCLFTSGLVFTITKFMNAYFIKGIQDD